MYPRALKDFGASYPVFLTVLHYTDSEAKDLRMIVLWVALNSIFIILKSCFEIGKITLHIWKKCNTMVTVFAWKCLSMVEPIIFAILMTVMLITLAICTTIWSKRKFELLPTIYIMFQNSYTRLLIFFVLRITPVISTTIVRIASAILHWKWGPSTAQILEILKCLKNSVYIDLVLYTIVHQFM